MARLLTSSESELQEVIIRNANGNFRYLHTELMNIPVPYTEVITL